MKKIVPKRARLSNISSTVKNQTFFNPMLKVISFAIIISLIISCKKNQSEVSQEANTTKLATMNINDVFHLTTQDFKLIDKYVNDIPKRDSLNKVIMSRVDFSKLVKTPKYKVDDVGGDDIGETEADYSIDQGEYLGDTGLGGDTYYNVRNVFAYSLLNKGLIVTIPLHYGPTIGVNLVSPITATVIGNNLGEFSIPTPAFNNAAYNNGGIVTGSTAGDLIEKKTMITTTNGTVVVKGGLNAGIYNAGVQLGGGIVVKSSYNNTSDYYFEFSYKLLYSIPGSPPNLTISGAYSKFKTY